MSHVTLRSRIQPLIALSLVAEQLLDFFPIEAEDRSRKQGQNSAGQDETKIVSATLDTILSDMSIRPAIPQVPVETENGHDTVNRPGTVYPLYAVIEQLPGAAKSFYGEAAELLGIRLETLVRAVYTMEKELRQVALH